MNAVKSIAIATVLVTSMVIGASALPARAADPKFVVQSGIEAVMDAYSLGYVDIGHKLEFVACGMNPVYPPTLAPSTPVSIRLMCHTLQGTSVNANLSIVYEPTEYLGEENYLGGDDAYAADGSIKVWNIDATHDGEIIKITTTVRQDK